MNEEIRNISNDVINIIRNLYSKNIHNYDALYILNGMKKYGIVEYDYYHSGLSDAYDIFHFISYNIYVKVDLYVNSYEGNCIEYDGGGVYLVKPKEISETIYV